MVRSVRQNSYIASQIVKVDLILLFIKLNQYFYTNAQRYLCTALKFDSGLICDAVNYSKLQVKEIF